MRCEEVPLIIQYLQLVDVDGCGPCVLENMLAKLPVLSLHPVIDFHFYHMIVLRGGGHLQMRPLSISLRHHVLHLIAGLIAKRLCQFILIRICQLGPLLQYTVRGDPSLKVILCDEPQVVPEVSVNLLPYLPLFRFPPKCRSALLLLNGRCQCLFIRDRVLVLNVLRVPCKVGLGHIDSSGRFAIKSLMQPQCFLLCLYGSSSCCCCVSPCRSCDWPGACGRDMPLLWRKLARSGWAFNSLISGSQCGDPRPLYVSISANISSFVGASAFEALATIPNFRFRTLEGIPEPCVDILIFLLQEIHLPLELGQAEPAPFNRSIIQLTKYMSLKSIQVHLDILHHCRELSVMVPYCVVSNLVDHSPDDTSRGFQWVLVNRPSWIDKHTSKRDTDTDPAVFSIEADPDSIIP